MADVPRIATHVRDLSSELPHLLSVVVLEHDQIVGSQRWQNDLDGLLTLWGEIVPTAPVRIREELRRMHRYLTLAVPTLVTFTPPWDGVDRERSSQRTVCGAIMLNSAIC